MTNQKEFALGIELGSTRIKAVLADKEGKVLAQGNYDWKNVLIDGLWSYPLEEAVEGLRESYSRLACNYFEKTGETLREIGYIGISGMMHGYIALDKDDKLLVPFRTWRNTNTADASKELSELLNFNIPMRWSVSQYYQSILEGMPHINKVAFLTTLSGYIHYLLTGKRVLGVDDASGMFPADKNGYDKNMMQKFGDLLKSKGVNPDFEKLLPEILTAGKVAGYLTEEGAKLLDKSGNLKPGSVFCAPEGDMGTGMVATNSVAVRRANFSLGTSANFTVVLEKPLKNHYPQIDVVATPDGNPCALIHSNNCCSEIDEWANLFREVLSLYGVETSKGEMLDKMFNASLKCDSDVGKLFGYNFLAGEPNALTKKGLPLTARLPDGKLNIANFSAMQIYSAVSAVILGMEMLEKEDVKVDSVFAHGGYYKTEDVGQKATSAALGGVPVTVTKTASEGGAYGIALLALYVASEKTSLSDFLDGIFAEEVTKTLTADKDDIEKFSSFYGNYKKYLPAEKYGSEL